MANGYLGKISAVVSANTGDFQAKLNAAAKDVQKFASSMQGSLTSAQSSSSAALRGIYTDAQKLERALTAISTRKLSFRGFADKDLDTAVNRMRALYSATAEISKPLAEAAKGFGKLPAEVQGAFLPALISAQKATESLADEINRTGSVGEQRFEAVAGKIDRTTAAMSRLKEASALVAALPTGQELGFQRPEMVAEIRRSQAIQETIAKLPPEAQSGMGQLVARQREAAEETQRLAAERERASLSRSADTTAETVAYQRQLAAQRQLNDQIEREVALRRLASDEAARRATVVDIPAEDLRRSARELVAPRYGNPSGEYGPPLPPYFTRSNDPLAVMEGANSPIFPENRRGNPSGTFGPTLPPGFGGSSDAGLGKSIVDSARQIDTLRSGIVSLKSQIDTLPDPLRARFVPAIRDAENRFLQLAASADSLPADIEAARGRLVLLTQDAQRATKALDFSQTFGGEGITGVTLGLDQRALQGYNAELQILQGTISRASADARGPAVEAFNRLRNAVAVAFDEGNIDTETQRARLAALRSEAVAAAAAVARVDAGALARQVGRAGDIGRGGADNFALALNQAAFAVDDFLSSTGGLEFKLRAISNNVTQLAFILGGTAGLFVGLGAVIAGQAAVGLIKWINNGRTAEDQTKSLNEALERQKSLAKEVADAFKSLGSSLLGNAFSKSAADTRSLVSSLDEMQKRLRELRDQKLGSLTPGVQQERANQSSLRKQLENETDPIRRVALQTQIRSSETREQAALARARANPVTADELRPLLSASGQNALRNATSFGDMRRIVSNEIAFERSMSNPNQTLITRLESMLERLEDPLQRAIDNLSIEVAKSSRIAALQIEQAQEEVSEAIKLGLPGARLFERELNLVAEQLAEAYSNLERAAEETDPRKRTGLVMNARQQVLAAESRRREIAAQTDALAYERIVDPQRQIDARMGRARGNLSAAGLEDGRLARRMREIEAERDRIRRDAQKPENDNKVMREILEAREEALNEEAAAIEAATTAIKIFAAALDKASEEVKGNLNSAQQAADEARRADLANSTPQTQEARRQAEADLEAQRQIERKAREEIAVERDRLEQMNQPEQARLEQINEQLMGGSGTPQEREALIREREAINARMEDNARASQRRIDEIRDSSTREEEQRRAGARGRELARTPEDRFAAETEQGLADIQAFFERRAEANAGLRPAGDAEAQAEAERRFREDREREARTATAAGRGREMFLTERERFRRDIKEGAARDMTAGAIDQAGLMNVQGRADLLRQGIKNQMESVAPMLQQFAEERQSALLQGPSRAALNVSDVSTTQGASELTRLLRGDDSAKDVNLAELRKQTQKFDDLIQAVKDANPGVLL